MGDEEEPVLYSYLGERATGETVDVTAGDEPKVLTKPVELLGLREGEGKASFPNKDTYEGGFLAGERSGSGAYVYAGPPPAEDEEAKPPVATYEGNWAAGVKEGVGILTFSSGAKYHGFFSGGVYQGQGTMFYENGDIYTGEWVAGKKHGTGTYKYKETGAKVSGTWLKGVIVEGSFVDKYGNTYEGGFASSPLSAGFVPGGTFTLASGATAELPVPGAPKWESQVGILSLFTCKDAAAAEAATLLAAKGLYKTMSEPGSTRAEALGKFTTSPTPPYGTRALPGWDDQSKVAFMELFTSEAALAEHKALLKGTLGPLLACGATGSAADFAVLEGPMMTLEKPGFGSGANHVIFICACAKPGMAAQLVEVAKFEIAANMAEPTFIRGTVIPPTAAEPNFVRWSVQWTAVGGVAAHKTFDHHKAAGARMMPLIDFSWGGGLEYDCAYHFAK